MSSLGRPTGTLQSRLVGGPKDVFERRSGDDLANVIRSFAKRRLGLLFSRRLWDHPKLASPKCVFTCRPYVDLW